MSKQQYIEQRVLEVANYIVNTKSTIRETAKNFKVGKSTVHKDMVERLTKINPQLAEQTREVLDINLSQRHIRGGNSTREKYKN